MSANVRPWRGRRRSPTSRGTHAQDADYDPLCECFSEEEIVDLSIAMAVVNAWNRISIGFRKVPDWDGVERPF
jgi:alkylhydroperoxidase family enzyme